MSRIEYTPNPPPQSLTEQSSRDLALYLQNELAQISNFIGEITDVDTTSNPNLFINGDPVIWQVGNSTGGGYGADGWWSPTRVSMAISGNVPTGFSKSAFLVATSGATPSIRQGIELPYAGVAGKLAVDTQVTISGYARATSSTPAIQLDVGFVDEVGSSTNRVTDVPLQTIYQIQEANTWEYFSHTYIISVSPVGTNTSYCPTVRGGDVNGSIRFTGLKFEIASVATPYQDRPIGEELALCQRYYQGTKALAEYRGLQASSTTGGVGGTVRFATTMRDTPTLITTNIVYTNASNLTTIPVEDCFRFTWTPAVGSTRVAFDWTADARL